MRGVRSFLVMLVALAAIGGYALYEWKKVPEDSGEKKDILPITLSTYQMLT